MSTITLRNTKGSPLTNTEIDDNFSNLNTDKYESGDSPSFSGLTVDSDSTYAIDVSRPSAGNTTLRITSGSTAGNDAVLRADIGNTTGTSAVYFGDTDTNGIGRITYEHNGDYMRFYTSSDEQMRIDSSGNVGIGTTVQANRLEVEGAVVAQGAVDSYTNDGLYLSNEGSSNFEIGAWRSGANAANLTFATDSGSDAAPVERMRITSSGDVGIGTSSPSARLHVSNNQGGGVGRILLDANVSSGYETSLNVTDTGFELTSSSNSRPIIFNTGSTPAERMRIDGSGNVGIGITSPTIPLHVYRSSGTSQLTVSSGGSLGTDVATIQSYAGSYYVQNVAYGTGTTYTTTNGSTHIIGVASGSGTLRLYSGGAEAVRIDSSGNVGIGTTSPSFPLDVETATGNLNARIHGGATAGDDAFLRIGIQNTTGSTGIYFGDSDAYAQGRIVYEHSDDSMRFWTSLAEEMRLEADGDLHVDGDVIAYSTTISDQRLKEDIQNIEGALEKVNSINGVTFIRKHNGERSAGVIAQELLEVLPEAVKEKELALQTADGESYYVVEYDAVTGLLVEAIKELTKRVEALES